MELNVLRSKRSDLHSHRQNALFSREVTCLDKAVWLEHQVFLATKSEPMYKMKYMSKVNEHSLDSFVRSFMDLLWLVQWNHQSNQEQC